MSQTVARQDPPIRLGRAEGRPAPQRRARRYLSGARRAAARAHRRAHGRVLFYHHDQLGSTRLLTDLRGKPAARYTYAPYGQPANHDDQPGKRQGGFRIAGLANTGGGGTATDTSRTSDRPTDHTGGDVNNPFGYAGQYTDAESGLQYLQARYYDPATAQFLTRDPLGSANQPYVYVGDSPVNATDPSGTFGCWPPWDANKCSNALTDTATAFRNSDLGRTANGWADGVTFGLSGGIEGALGAPPNYCDPLFQRGQVFGQLTGVALGGAQAFGAGVNALRALPAADSLGGAARLGETIAPLGRSYARYDTYLNDVASQYGINLEGCHPSLR